MIRRQLSILSINKSLPSSSSTTATIVTRRYTLTTTTPNDWLLLFLISPQPSSSRRYMTYKRLVHHHNWCIRSSSYRQLLYPWTNNIITTKLKTSIVRFATTNSSTTPSWDTPITTIKDKKKKEKKTKEKDDLDSKVSEASSTSSSSSSSSPTTTSSSPSTESIETSSSSLELTNKIEKKKKKKKLSRSSTLDISQYRGWDTLDDTDSDTDEQQRNTKTSESSSSISRLQEEPIYDTTVKGSSSSSIYDKKIIKPFDGRSIQNADYRAKMEKKKIRRLAQTNVFHKLCRTCPICKRQFRGHNSMIAHVTDSDKCYNACTEDIQQQLRKHIAKKFEVRERKRDNRKLFLLSGGKYKVIEDIKATMNHNDNNHGIDDFDYIDANNNHIIKPPIMKRKYKDKTVVPVNAAVDVDDGNDDNKKGDIADDGGKKDDVDHHDDSSSDKHKPTTDEDNSLDSDTDHDDNDNDDNDDVDDSDDDEDDDDKVKSDTATASTSTATAASDEP